MKCEYNKYDLKLKITANFSEFLIGFEIVSIFEKIGREELLFAQQLLQ